MTTLARRKPSEPITIAGIAERAWRAFLPPTRVSVAAYAAEHRMLQNEGGGYVGRWRHSMAPYLVEPMECLTSLDFLTTCIVGPGQCGKTSVGENWLLHSVCSDPANLLWYMQTDDGAEAYVKSRINPMIDLHDGMRERLGPRSVDDSLHFKRFRGMSVEFLSATLRNLINKTAGRIITDEVDAYAMLLGDVKALVDVRRQTFGNESMLLAMSHPDLAKGIVPERDWHAGIMSIYADSDRRLWWWPCARCRAWSSPAPIAARVMTIEYPEDGTLDEIEREARLRCPVNDCLIDETERLVMSARGRWIGSGQEIDEDGTVRGELVRRKTAGFWIVGAMSPFLLAGIGGLARARVKAERELDVSGEDSTLRQVMVKQWGVPYQPPRSVGSIDANELAERAEHDLRLGVVPDGVRFLTIGVDCQIAHFEYLVRGWGVAGESWIVDRGRIAADPATSPDDWDALIDLFTRAWPLADGSGRMMTARAAAFDSAGAPGVTQQAYSAWTRWRKARAVRLFGKINGRDAWSIVPTKGDSALGAPRLQVVYPDTSRKSNVAAGAGSVPLVRFNPNDFKNDLRGQLIRADAGPWCIHFPRDLRSKEPPHAWFEQAVAEERNPKSGRWERKTSSSRNEALDLLVMTHVVAHLQGLPRINWERPPNWAAPWDANATVTASASASPAPAAAVKSKPAPAEDVAEKKPGSMEDFIGKFK